MKPAAIGKALGRAVHSVRWALDINNAREKTRRRTNARRAAERGERVIPVPRAERIAPVKIDALALARQWVAGEFDRAELSRRLRGEA